MSEQFQSVLLRRTLSKPVSAIKSKLRVSSNPILKSARINQSHLQSFIFSKLKPKPLKRKNTLQKFHELRKKMATKANQRIKKITVNAVTAELKQMQKKEFVEQIDQTGILCNKAVVHLDKQKQERTWKRGLVESNQIFKSRSKSKPKLFLRMRTEISDMDKSSTRKFSEEMIEEVSGRKSYLHKKIEKTFISLVGQESLINSTSTAKSGITQSGGWRKSSEETNGEVVVRKIKQRKKSGMFFGKNATDKVEPWKTHQLFVETEQFEEF